LSPFSKTCVLVKTVYPVTCHLLCVVKAGGLGVGDGDSERVELTDEAR
jgi:hypothetical protein